MARDATPADVLEGRASWCIVEGEALATLQALPAASVGAVITDPPYSSGGFTRGDRTSDAAVKYSAADRPLGTFTGDSRDQRSFAYWCALWLSAAQRATVQGGPVVQFTDWRQLPSTTDAIQAGGWVWRGIWVWAKPGGTVRPMMGRFSSSCEYAVWGTNGPALDLPEVGVLPGHLEAAIPRGDERVHLTQKPEAVMEAVVRISPPGSVVLDPFTGSGTTGIAALRLGRRFIGVEQDAGYAQVARERLAAERRGLNLQAHLAGQGSIFDLLGVLP